MGAFIVVCGAVCSTLGTLNLKKTDHFRKFLPSFAVLVFYSGSTWFLAHAMKHMPVALAHAAWSGLVALLLLGIDRLYFKVALFKTQIAGFFCIMTGIAVLSVGR